MKYLGVRVKFKWKSQRERERERAIIKMQKKIQREMKSVLVCMARSQEGRIGACWPIHYGARNIKEISKAFLLKLYLRAGVGLVYVSDSTVP